MVTMDDAELWRACWSYKDHGKSWQAVYEREHPPGFRWLHEGWGSNWRLTEMQAAVGRIQLRRMPDWHAARRRNAEALAAAFARLSALRVPAPPDRLRHAWYKFYAFVRPEALAAGWSRDRIMAEVNTAGVPCFAGSGAEIYREKAFADAGLAPPQRLPAAVELGETALMFLVHPTLAEADIDRTIAVVAAVVGAASR